MLLAAFLKGALNLSTMSLYSFVNYLLLNMIVIP